MSNDAMYDNLSSGHDIRLQLHSLDVCVDDFSYVTQWGSGEVAKTFFVNR